MKILLDKELLAFKGKQESQYFVDFVERGNEIIERIENGVENTGDDMPWKKTHDKVRFRGGEISLWAGINGHGKSLLLSHIMAHLMKTSTILVASLEMSIPATGARLVRQIAGIEKPTPSYIESILHWTTNRAVVYDQLDTVPADRIVGMCMYAMEKLKVRHIIIDSMMKCGIGTDDFNSQKAFVDSLAGVAKKYNGHIHLVHHMRKGSSENDIPDKFDVKGAGEITDMVDNLFIVHRNKLKEQEIEEGKSVDELVPDTTLTVAKQRHGEWEGRIALYFDKASTQYLQSPRANKEWFPIEVQDEVG